MPRDPKVPRQRTPKKEDVMKSSPAHKLGARHEGGNRGVARNTPAFGKRGSKPGRGKS